MVMNYGDAYYSGTALAYGNYEFDTSLLVVPVITLTGSGVTVNLNDSYSEPGYTATDGNDGDITGNVVVTGTVDTATAGVYTLRYNVTNSVGNAATEVVRLVTVINFWEFVPPQSRIISLSSDARNISQDPDSTLSYWFDMTGLIGGQTITSYEVDPDGELSGVTVTCNGLNNVTETDNDGTQYTAGQLIGFCISGGVNNAIYSIVIRYTLSGGDVDDKTITLHVIDQ